MISDKKQTNKLINEASPYLLQHAHNPVDWYPWGDEAFRKAKEEDKPIFLSIGYSTCHWCHVMAHESFEDKEVAQILNKHFVSIKVDKEERPDIDSIYMSVCQALTGSGGWPTSIFMTCDQKPFFAGTYFPKSSGYGMIGFVDLLKSISEKWGSERTELLRSADKIIEHIKTPDRQKGGINGELQHDAVLLFKQSYDDKYGGFGRAPKFPTPHNLLFLMDYYECFGDNQSLKMTEHTLFQMYKGGIFDHIGYGFSRYSTDKYFLVPHFEKMLYDNALLLMSYTKTYYLTKNTMYKDIAEKTAEYVLRELTGSDGGFYSAQDADSEGVEGKYYVFDYEEIIKLLGEDIGKQFNDYYGITKKGNFEGMNIPNLLNNTKIDDRFSKYLPQIYEYRKSRTKLHLDDKILTSWNSLMISALALMYRVFDEEKYIVAAKIAYKFIENNLYDGDTLYVSFRGGLRSGKGFLDDYAFYIFAALNMYDATLDSKYLEEATKLYNKVIADFSDKDSGGFFLYGSENEQLIVKPKETYDGAIPSGNSVMAYNLVRLSQITGKEDIFNQAKRQIEFMSLYANDYPAGYCFFMLALSAYLNPYDDIVCVVKENLDIKELINKVRMRTNIRILDKPTEEYKLINNETTFYVCKNHSCLPPTNDLMELLNKN